MLKNDESEGAAMLTFDSQGLIPAVIVDDATGEVLMMAFMNQDALQKTRESGYTHFFSRSRNTIWRKGEQSGNIQEVRDILVNCEENSLLVRVIQHGPGACHEGYRSCYFRRLTADDEYKVVAERLFDPETVYAKSATVSQPLSLDTEQQYLLEGKLQQLYGVYLYLRDHDMSEVSNTSRLLQERSQGYLAARLADELEELAEVQSGEHVHSGRRPDTILEGSQVAYWIFLLASGCSIAYQDFLPHLALLEGYSGHYSEARVIELRQECLSMVASEDMKQVAQGLRLGFSLIGWACAEAQVSPLAPAEYDLEQMRHKGLVK